MTIEWEKSEVRDIPIAEMHTSPAAQRDFKQPWADELASNFDVELVKLITVNRRDGAYMICDGQHRVAALRALGFGDQKIRCDVYENLTEDEEAELFLKLNNRLNVDAQSKFKVSVTAKRAVEVDITRIVGEAQLRIGSRSSGCVSAVGTLREVYSSAGPEVLARSLAIIRDSYGEAGLLAPVIRGIGQVLARYTVLDERDEQTVATLSAAHGGVSGLMNQASMIKRQVGGSQYNAVSAAMVTLLNRGGGLRLPTWYKDAA